MKKLLITVILTFIYNPIAMAWTPELESEFQQRKQEYLSKFTPGKYGSTAYEYEKHSYPRAMIDLIKGNRESAIKFLESEDAQSSNHQHTLGIDFYSGFTLKGQIRKYFGFGEFLTPNYKSRMKEAMRIFTEEDPLSRRFPYKRKFWSRSTDDCDTWIDCRNTDNLRAMRDTSAYLMAEETGNEATRELYKNRIADRVRSLYHIGQGEWDSEVYLGHTITSYLNLYDFAQDPEVKAIAKSALDWFTITGALKYWRGGFGGPSKRDYSGGKCTWCSDASRTLGFYFGDSPTKGKKSDTDLVHVINSSYRPPMAAVKLARKQFPKPMEMLNSKPEYENWKPGKSDQPGFHETLYFGHTFQLGTLAKGSGGDWNGFTLMAYNSRIGVDYFIAASGTSPKISTSSQGNNAVGQYQNLVMWLNDQPAPFQFFFPQSAQVEIIGGKLFIKLEKTWLAISPINLEFGTTQNLERYPDSQILIATPQGNKMSGFVLEVGEGRSWENFQKLVSFSQLKVENSQAEYISLHKKIKVQHQGEELPKVWRNGNLHNWQNHFNVYSSDKPFIDQGWKSGKLNLRFLNGQEQKFEVRDNQSNSDL